MSIARLYHFILSPAWRCYYFGGVKTTRKKWASDTKHKHFHKWVGQYMNFWYWKYIENISHQHKLLLMILFTREGEFLSCFGFICLSAQCGVILRGIWFWIKMNTTYSFNKKLITSLDSFSLSNAFFLSSK